MSQNSRASLQACSNHVTQRSIGPAVQHSDVPPPQLTALILRRLPTHPH